LIENPLDRESRGDQLRPEGRPPCRRGNSDISLSQTSPIDSTNVCSLLNMAVIVDVDNSPTISEQSPAPPATGPNPRTPNARDAVSRRLLDGYFERRPAGWSRLADSLMRCLVYILHSSCHTTRRCWGRKDTANSTAQHSTAQVQDIGLTSAKLGLWSYTHQSCRRG